jgi:hypothetical protein
MNFFMDGIVADRSRMEEGLGTGRMNIFRLEELDALRAANDAAYPRFLRESTMSAGP